MQIEKKIHPRANHNQQTTRRKNQTEEPDHHCVFCTGIQGVESHRKTQEHGNEGMHPLVCSFARSLTHSSTVIDRRWMENKLGDDAGYLPTHERQPWQMLPAKNKQKFKTLQQWGCGGPKPKARQAKPQAATVQHHGA